MFDEPIIKFSGNFSDDLRFALSWAILSVGVCVLAFAIGTIWDWKETKPKDEKFWFICGVFLHWLATVNARSIDLLSDSHAILVRTSHLLVSFNLVFAFGAGIFYCRALTQHWKKDLWFNIMWFAIIVFFLTYFWRMF